VRSASAFIGRPRCAAEEKKQRDHSGTECLSPGSNSGDHTRSAPVTSKVALADTADEIPFSSFKARVSTKILHTEVVRADDHAERQGLLH
jgi:hypothetical protein